MSNLYPFPSFHFVLSVESNSNETNIGFREVTGINQEIEVVNYTEGGSNNFKYLVPKFLNSNLVLKHGYAQKGHPILDWCQKSINTGLNIPIQSNNILIYLMDEHHNPVFSWRFEDAWPIKLLISDLNSSMDDIVIEVLEFSYKNFTKL